VSGEIVPIERAANDMREFFKARKGAIKMALANAGVTADRVMAALWTSAEKSPQLWRCEVRSVYKCMLLSAQSGLIPDGVTQHAHLIPRMNRQRKDEHGKPLAAALECSLQIGYRGLLVLVRRSGQVGVVKATLVRKGDAFRVLYGTDDRIEHEPLPNVAGEDGKPREITHAYCIAKFTSGQVDFEVMDIAEIEQLRVRSGATGPAWGTDYGEMAKKTVLRRLCKRLPQSEDMQRLLEIDAAAETGAPQEIDVQVPPPDDSAEAAKPVEATVTDATPETPASTQDQLPDPSSAEGKALAAELDRQNAQDAAPEAPSAAPAATASRKGKNGTLPGLGGDR